MAYIVQGEPLLAQLASQGLELDQRLMRALEVSASQPDLDPEDVGFPDSYLTLALYRLNSILTRLVQLDESRLNLFHEYKRAPACKPERVRPGFRLARVLEHAADLAAPSPTIGVGHYLRAIVQMTLDEKAYPAPGFPNLVLHNTFSAETLLIGMGHSAWTPVEKAPGIVDLLGALDGRNAVDDVQYILGVEEGRLVLRPTSLLDTYQAQLGRGIARAAAGVLTHLRDGFAAVTPDEILGLEDLINSKTARESDLQAFFEAHPQFLRMWDFREVYPQVYLTREDEGPLVPDFVLIDRELHRAAVIDLKLPSAKLVRRQSNRERFSALITEARAQLLEYRDWFEDRANRLRFKERFGMDVFRPRIGVVIGRSSDFHSELDRQKLASQASDLEILTYDDILRLAESRLALVRSACR